MNRSRLLPCLLFSLFPILAACSGDKPANRDNAPLEVGTVEVAAERMTISTDLPGRVESTQVAEVRARVPGIVLERSFQEGSDVEAGQLLFRIDPAPFQSDVLQARANLERARATLYEAELLQERYAPLVESKAISRQIYDQSVAAHRQALAEVAQSEAALQRAELDLSYATVRAPISGRIGRAKVTEGALVGQGEATPMATIQVLDPVYVNVTQSVNDLLQLRHAFSNGRLNQLDPDAAVPVAISLGNGQPYPAAGKLLFSDISVDPTTGQVTLRAVVPNPRGVLLPGMYVRASVQQGIREAALAVPAQAVQRDSNGIASVMVINADDIAERREVRMGAMVGERWIVEQGLYPGDRVMVDRVQRIQSGMKVAPVDWTAPDTPT